MVVYADVLVFLNLIINYFLLLAVSKIIRKDCSVWRMVLAAFWGAVSSLYIFLPPLSIWLEGILKLAVCIIVSLVAFGFKGFKGFLKNMLLLFGVTVAFGGIMYAVWILFKPRGMVINNSVVYFDISVLALLGFTVFGYIIFSLLFKIFSRSSPLASDCSITVFVNGKSITLSGIVDTGNSIEDIFSQGEIIICGPKVKEKLFGGYDIRGNTALKTRYRLLPCSTVSGADLLEGVRCDKAVILVNNKTITLKKPILAFSKTELQDSEAIINPNILG
ncbi:MAG: sigma-E processing peptidase SpoIIGA [Clostridia bacterium]|nr:sigma-E processing peptidase SpoIIGA [Clostridia bacterium]